jgi:hypothetical protein
MRQIGYQKTMASTVAARNSDGFDSRDTHLGHSTRCPDCIVRRVTIEPLSVRSISDTFRQTYLVLSGVWRHGYANTSAQSRTQVGRRIPAIEAYGVGSRATADAIVSLRLTTTVDLTRPHCNTHLTHDDWYALHMRLPPKFVIAITCVSVVSDSADGFIPVRSRAGSLRHLAARTEMARLDCICFLHKASPTRGTYVKTCVVYGASPHLWRVMGSPGLWRSMTSLIRPRAKAIVSAPFRTHIPVGVFTRHQHEHEHEHEHEYEDEHEYRQSNTDGLRRTATSTQIAMADTSQHRSCTITHIVLRYWSICQSCVLSHTSRGGHDARQYHRDRTIGYEACQSVYQYREDADTRHNLVVLSPRNQSLIWLITVLSWAWVFVATTEPQQPDGSAIVRLSARVGSTPTNPISHSAIAV